MVQNSRSSLATSQVANLSYNDTLLDKQTQFKSTRFSSLVSLEDISELSAL